MSYLCALRQDSLDRIFSSESMNEKTIGDLKSDLKCDDEMQILFKTPSICFPTDDNEEISTKYPDAYISTRPNTTDIPDYGFFQIKVDTSDVLFLCSIKYGNEISTDQAVFRFNTEIECHTVQEFMTECERCFGWPITIKDFFMNGKRIDPEEPTDILYRGKSFYIDVDFSDVAIKKMKHREALVNEIITTETTYVKDLSTLINFWKPSLSKYLDQSEINLIFKDLDMVLGTHQQFLSALSKNKVTYFSHVCLLFIEFSQYFKSSFQFIANHPNITTLLRNKMKNKQFDMALRQMAAEVGCRDIFSYLITPVQRLPRYSLFVKELEKYTPMSHLDYYWLDGAMSAINLATHQADMASARNKMQDELYRLQKRIRSEITIVNPSRVILEQKKVTFDSFFSKSGTFYLFNDLIVVTADYGKNSSLLYHSNSAKFKYSLVKDNPNAIMLTTFTSEGGIYKSRKDHVVNFENKAILQDILRQIDEVKKARIQKLSNKYMLEWTCIEDTDLPQRAEHASSRKGDSIIFFGGNSENSNSFNLYDTITKKVHLYNSSIPPRRGHTLSQVGRFLYLIGGVSKNIDIRERRQNSWVPFADCGNDFTARSGHTAIVFNNQIFVFGGKSPSRGYLDELLVINPKERSIKKFYSSRRKPSPRYGHSAVVYDNMMYIFGGQNDQGIFNDLWRFDLEGHIWSQIIVESVDARAFHNAVVVGDEMLIFGGTTLTGKAPTIVISLDLFKAFKVTELGNAPPPLKQFTATLCGISEIIIYGGYELFQDIPTNRIYSAKLSASWLKHIEASNNDGQKPKARELAAKPRKLRQTIFESDSVLSQSMLRPMTYAAPHEEIKVAESPAQAKEEPVLSEKAILASLKRTTDELPFTMKRSIEYGENSRTQRFSRLSISAQMKRSVSVARSRRSRQSFLDV